MENNIIDFKEAKERLLKKREEKFKKDRELAEEYMQSIGVDFGFLSIEDDGDLL